MKTKVPSSKNNSKGLEKKNSSLYIMDIYIQRVCWLNILKTEYGLKFNEIQMIFDIVKMTYIYPRIKIKGFYHNE